MKNKFTLALALACTSMFAVAQSSFTIKGNLQGQGNEKIILRGPDGNIVVDAKSNSFELSGPAGKEPFVGSMDTGVDRKLYLGAGKTGMYQPAQPLDIVLTAGAKINITGTADGINLASVTGDPFNESFTLYRKAMNKDVLEMQNLQKEMVEIRIMGLKEGMDALGKRMLDNRKSMAETRKKFIKEHPDAFASLYYLSVAAREYAIPELEAAYNSLSATYKETRYAKSVKDRIDAGKIMSAGGPSPDFTKPDINGKLVSLSQFRGKYVLLDFWGSWCGPCRAANPHLKELYSTYSPKGFEILGVSSEKVSSQTQAEAMWKQAVEKDGLTWTNVLNNETTMKQDVVQMYAIEAYPTQILLDKEGRIIAKWVGAGGKALDDKLKEIFK